VPRSADPVFDDVRKFPVTADEQYLRYLQHNPVRFVVFDDDERDVSASCFLGVCVCADVMYSLIAGCFAG
jgi:hypothetical protein